MSGLFEARGLCVCIEVCMCAMRYLSCMANSLDFREDWNGEMNVGTESAGFPIWFSWLRRRWRLGGWEE